MAYLVFIVIALLLLVGFFALTEYEMRRGARLFAPERARLDVEVERAAFILAHVDFGAFFSELAVRAAQRVVHDVAHLSLLVVRAIERALTRLVRYLRTRGAAVNTAAPRGEAREFVKTLSSLKNHLEANRPEIPAVYPDRQTGEQTPE